MKKILKLTAFKPDSNPSNRYYLNTVNGVIYSLNPQLIEQIDVKVIDATNEFCSLEAVKKQSIRLIEKYIKTCCQNNVY